MGLPQATDLFGIKVGATQGVAGSGTAYSVTWAEMVEAMSAIFQIDDMYLASEVDALVNAKANSADVYTSAQTDTAIADAIDTLVGSLGTAAYENIGYFATAAQGALASAALPAANFTKAAVDALGINATHLGGQLPAYYLAWDNITGKPSTFTPSAHNHAATEITTGVFANARIQQSNVTQHQAALAIAWSQLTSVPSDVTNITALLAAKAPLANPTFTGVPAGPTATPGTNTTQLATTAFVTAAVVAAGGYDTTQFNADFATKDTEDLAEGATNVYYTVARANSAIDNRVNKAYVEALGIDVPWADLTGVPSTFTPSSHTHAIADVTGLQTALDGKVAASLLGAANGVATLDSSGLIPSSQLPSFVDDVIEAANFAALPGSGSTGKIYVTLDNNKTYRWSGSAYVEIPASPGSTDSVTEGSTNLYYTTARANSAIDTRVNKAFVDALGINATHLGSQLPAYYLDYANFTNKPTLGTAASVNTGTSGAAIPLLNGANTWSGAQTVASTNLNMTGSDAAKFLLASESTLWRWTSASTAIDGLIPGTALGVILEGPLNGHLVLGIRGNDTSDGLYIIDNTANGTGTYNRLLASLTPLALSYFGAQILGPAGTAAAPGYSLSGDPNTGFYGVSADVIGISTGGTFRFGASTYLYGAAAGSASIQSAAGTASLPAYTFVGDENTGLYRVGADDLGVSIGGTLRMQITATSTSIYSSSAYGNTLRAVSDASVNNWARIDWVNQNTANTGIIFLDQAGNFAMRNGAAGPIQFYQDATLRAAINAAGQFGIGGTGLGSAATPDFTWISDPNTGIYRSGADQFSIATGGIERFRVGSNGSLSGYLAAGTFTAMTLNGDGNTGVGPSLVLNFTNAGAAPTVGNDIGRLTWNAFDSGLATETYGYLGCTVDDATAGSEDATFYVTLINNGVRGVKFSVSSAGLGTFSERVRVGNGTAALPAYSTTGDPDTGWYWNSSGIWSYSQNGTARFNISDYFFGATSGGAIKSAAGTAALPALTFVDDTDTGLYPAGANILGFATAGVARFGMTSTFYGSGGTGAPAMTSAAGTVAAPAFTFITDTDMGLYRIGADNLGISLGGVKYVDLAAGFANFSMPIGSHGSDPNFNLYETDAGADAKRWDIVMSGGSLFFRAVNDAYSVANNWLTVTRSGASPVAATYGIDAVLADIGPTSALSAGFRGAPRNRQDSSYTLVLGDAGKSIIGYGSTASQTWTIPANASVAYPIGTTITFINMRSVACSIACTSDTMYLAGSGAIGTRTLAAYSWATALKTDTNNWIIGGTGLT